MATPASVPPLPTAQVKASTRPFPDFRASGQAMPVPVGDIIELIGPEGPVRLALGQALGQPAGDMDVIVRVFIGNGTGQAQIGPAQAQRVFFLLALGFRHDDDSTETQDVADQSQADPRIAGGSLDDCAAGFELALCDGVLDQGKGGPIFHRPAGVKKFGLAQNIGVRPMLSRNPLRISKAMLAPHSVPQGGNVPCCFSAYCRSWRCIKPIRSRSARHA
jgi:hypothetical protein